MKYQFCIRFDQIDRNSAASKAVVDCNAIFSENGYKDYTFTVGDNSNKLAYYFSLFRELSRFFLSVKRGSLVGIQYPLLSINNVFKYFIRAAKLKGVKFFCIIHDLEALRTGGKDDEMTAKEVLNLNYYDQVIVHNLQMEAWLTEKGVTKPMVSLELFDYLSDDFTVKTSENPRDAIVYAGNLTKSAFVYALPLIKRYHFNLYGPGFHQAKNQEGQLNWQGEFSPDHIAKELKGSFGLIWDGNHIERCDEILGNYLKYNNPHKCSLYIAAGLPVIAPESSAMGHFIKKFNIGVLVENLHDLENITINEQEYRDMKSNVMKIRNEIINGTYFTKAIHSVEEELC